VSEQPRSESATTSRPPAAAPPTSASALTSKERAAKPRIQPHMAHVPGPDGKRREVELVAESASCAAEKSQLAELAAANEPWMRALASRRIPAHLKARFDGEDVVQTAFLSMCEREKSGSPAVEGNVKGYLIKAVRNGVCDAVRRHMRRRRSTQAERAVTEKMLDAHVCPREQPHETIEKEELRTVLLDALGQLSAIDRRLVQLKYVEQMTWLEIGRLLDLPDTTARRKGLEAFGRLMRLVE
jgi:RNA polymerase sigma factor (sigma-70 family)